MVNTTVLAMMYWMYKKKKMIGAPWNHQAWNLMNLCLLWCQGQCMWDTRCRSGHAGSPDLWGWRKIRIRSRGRDYREQSKYSDALQGLEAARKYIQQFEMKDILVTCSKLENKLYTLKHQENSKQKYWIVKKKNSVLILKIIAISEPYFKQSMKKWVLLFWKLAKN